jgi:hypothetical protein
VALTRKPKIKILKDMLELQIFYLLLNFVKKHINFMKSKNVNVEQSLQIIKYLIPVPMALGNLVPFSIFSIKII